MSKFITRFLSTALPLAILALTSHPQAAAAQAVHAQTTQLPATQPTAPPASAPAPSSSPAPPALPPASKTLAPALSTLRQTLTTLHPDKWKLPPPVLRDTQNNLDSIRRDLDNTLPPLLAAADASPSAIPSVLPAYRNIEALYDVLLRVNQVALLVAPDPQVAALQQAMGNLEDSRRTLGDNLQSAAVSQTQQLADVRASLRKIQSTPPPPAPVCPPPPPATTTPKKKPAPKPAPKPTPPTSSAPTQ
jgi:outer membrane biosynthesis protein TonB